MRVMIRYKVKPDQMEPNLTLLRSVYEELEATQPHGLRYATYQLEDRVSFLAFVETDDGMTTAPHHQLRSFHRYRAVLDALCDEPPAVTMLQEVGSFGFR
jgi:quinol monooxygenase YgiN